MRTRYGYTALEQGDVEVAKRVLASDPWSADLTYGIGYLYYLMDKREDSAAYFTRFIEIAPNSPVIRRIEHEEAPSPIPAAPF